MASRKGIDGKREIFSFQDIYLLTKILGSLIVVPSKHMTGYERILADLDLLFLKSTHVIWIPMMISRRQVKWIL